MQQHKYQHGNSHTKALLSVTEYQCYCDEVCKELFSAHKYQCTGIEVKETININVTLVMCCYLRPVKNINRVLENV